MCIFLERLYSNITLEAFNVLERLAFKMTGNGISGSELARLLDSISSLTFSIIVLDVSDREEGCRANCGDAPMEKFLDEMKALDLPLCRLANRTLRETGRRFSLMLLANDPAAVAGSFREFQEVGNTWKGAKLIRGGKKNYHWSSITATDSESQTIDESVLSFVKV